MKKHQIHNNSINQVTLIIIILLFSLLVFKSLLYYLPGFLGAITLYILFRKPFNYLTKTKKWNKSVASILMIILCIVFIVLPFWALIDYTAPKVIDLVDNKSDIMAKFDSVKNYLKNKPYLDKIDLSDTAMMQSMQKAAKYIPSFLNSVAEIVINLLVSFFVLYFMQVYNEKMEKTIENAIPFSQKSKQQLWEEVDMMVRSNAIGIPILGLCQGVVAGIGYWIFGIDNPIFLAILTAFSTIIPVIGTMAVYVPASVYLLATNDVGSGIGMLLYGIILIGSIDNVLRFTILKKLGDVPPLITVFGVLLGLNLFGMIGLIFGPLILSSIGVLWKVYANEYGRSKQPILYDQNESEPQDPNKLIL